MKGMAKNVFVLFWLLVAVVSFVEAKAYDLKDTVTVYVHGFDTQGYRQNGVYGDEKVEPLFANSDYFLGDHLIASVGYYGDTPPEYYTQQDIDDIDAVTKQYGGGIPRYAMIVAKFTKHLLVRTGAKQVNFISGSMGSLVTRWLIEKDVEGLASEKKIARWLSIEGVVNGNYAASESLLFKLYDSVEDVSIDIKHMKYNWVTNAFGSPRAVGKSPYYKDILLGFETSTDDHPKEGLLTKLLLLHGQFWPNDGYQISRDTYFSSVLPEYRFMNESPTHTYLHQTHLGVKDSHALWAEVVNFLSSNKRVRITLRNVKVDDIKEKNKWYYKKLPAEVIFESRVYSPALNLFFGMDDPVSERLYDGGVPPIVKYKKKRQTKTVDQVLFDDFVTPYERAMTIQINAKEIDGDLRYKVYESIRDRRYANIGSSEFSVPLVPGVYPFKGDKFSGDVVVEVIEYPFNQVGIE